MWFATIYGIGLVNRFKRTAVSTVYRPANDERVPTLTEFAIKRPIVVIPGIMGSDLWTKNSSGHADLQVWPPFAAPRGFPELAPLELLDLAAPKDRNIGNDIPRDLRGV